MNDLEIIVACEAQMTGTGSMAAAGMPAPKTLADVVATMWAAQARLSAIDKRRLAIRDRMELDYMSSATKSPVAYPNRRPLPMPT
jgi:hypothetical protein